MINKKRAHDSQIVRAKENLKLSHGSCKADANKIGPNQTAHRGHQNQSTQIVNMVKTGANKNRPKPDRS